METGPKSISPRGCCGSSNRDQTQSGCRSRYGKRNRSSRNGQGSAPRGPVCCRNASCGDRVKLRYNKAAGHAEGLLSHSNFDDPNIRLTAFFDRHHRALVVRGANKFRVEEVPTPRVKPGDVLVKVAYAGICGTDVEIVEGRLGYFASGMAKFPIVPGHEFAGRIAAVGANSGDWNVGDPVVVERIWA